MVEIEKPRIVCMDSADDVSYGKYVVEPLERGYRTNFGQLPETNPAILTARHGCDLHQDRRRPA